MPECRHCPDGHDNPRSKPWGVYVASTRDGDGPPATLHVAPSNGSHVAESDADWLRSLIRGDSADAAAIIGEVLAPLHARLAAAEFELAEAIQQRRDAEAAAEQGRAEERAAIARMVRSHFAAVDDPLYEDVRILCERIERGEHLPAAEPTTPPKPAPEMRCSECGRPLVGQPCGLVHAVARMQIAAIRMGLSSLLKGGGHA